MKKLLWIPLILGAWPLGAADFWQTKKFDEWNDKEVEKVLKDSPWARTFTVETGKRSGDGGARSPNPNRGMGGGNIGGMGGGGGRGGRGGGGGMGTPGGAAGTRGDNYPRQASATVIVRWLSALPVKHALARAQYGSEAATSPDAVRSFERQETQYVVALIGVPPKLVRKGDQMKANAVLRVKGQEAIPAANAKADLRDNGVYLTLYFPREGHPIQAEDGEAALEVKLGGKTVTQKFKLKSMVYAGKLEL